MRTSELSVSCFAGVREVFSSARPPVEAMASTSVAMMALRELMSATDWWDAVNNSPAWQDLIFHVLAALFGLVAVVALVRSLPLFPASPFSFRSSFAVLCDIGFRARIRTTLCRFMGWFSIAPLLNLLLKNNAKIRRHCFATFFFR